MTKTDWIDATIERVLEPLSYHGEFTLGGIKEAVRERLRDLLTTDGDCLQPMRGLPCECEGVMVCSDHPDCMFKQALAKSSARVAILEARIKELEESQ